MNTLEFSRRINKGIEECSRGMIEDPNEGNRIYIKGVKAGLEAAHKIFNEVNHEASESDVMLNNCIGYGSRRGVCREKVPRRFLQLWCTLCTSLRSKEKGLTERMDEDDVITIPFRPSENDHQ